MCLPLKLGLAHFRHVNVSNSWIMDPFQGKNSPANPVAFKIKTSWDASLQPAFLLKTDDQDLVEVRC